MAEVDNTVSASDALALLHAQGVPVSDFTLYGYLDSKQIEGYRLPTSGGKPGRWRVNRDSIYKFVSKTKGESK